MRYLVPAIFALSISLGHAQLANGDFEQAREATEPPTAWQLATNLLPEGWTYNGQYGGPVGLVEDAHAGKYALRFAAGEPHVAHALNATFPVQTGDVYELSAWAKAGALELTFYEYAADSKWLRTVPAVARIEAGEAWTEGGGFHIVTDPEVVQLTVVLSTDKAGVTVDDVALRKVEPSAQTGADVVLENQGCRLTLGGNGSVKGLYDKTLKQERAVATGRPFMRARRGAWNLPISRLRKQGNILTATFGDNQATAVIRWETKPYWMSFVLQGVRQPDVAALTLFDLQLPQLQTVGHTIAITYDDRAVQCLQTLNFDGEQILRQVDGTNVNMVCSFPDLTRPLYANCLRGCAFLTCPRSQLWTVMREVEQAYGLPSPQLEGKPGKLSQRMKRSYFFVTDLSEENVDEVISYAKRGHFGYVLILESAWSHGSGSFRINERNFPSGLDGLKATIAKIQKAGFPVGLHMLTAGINLADPLVTPVPDDGIYVDVQAELAADIDEQADFIPTRTAPTGFPANDLGWDTHGTIVRIGEEMIRYGSLKLDPPYGFAGCTRGWNGSQAAVHAAASSIKHLYLAYGLFLIDTRTDLLDRVADNVARTWNYCNCDGIYFDGSEMLQGDHSYYNARLHTAYYSRFNKKDIIAQASSFSPYSWHLISRMASADGFRDIKLYLDKRTGGSFAWYSNNLMPLDIGWYAINPNIRPDDIEYVCSRSLAFDSSVSIETGTRELRTVPQAMEMVDTIARWEDLRLSGRVPAEVRKLMQEPGKEFHLTTLKGQQALVPVQYTDFASIPPRKRTIQDDQQKLTEVDMPSELHVKNERATSAQIELQLEAGPVFKPGPSYAEGQPLELFEAEMPGAAVTLDTNLFNPTVHGSRATSEGVTQEVTLITDDVKEGQAACSFRATSTRTDNQGWATFGRGFEPPLALENYEYLGVWVKGDGKAELLKIQLWDQAGKVQDQYITIDFTGWQFIELAKPDPPLLDTSKIVSLQFYYNGMPRETTSHCLLDGLKVLSRPTMTERPVMRVNGEPVTFPIRMSAGDRLVMRSAEDCWLYAAGQQERVKVTPEGLVPEGAQDVTVAVDEASVSNQMLFRAGLHWAAEAVLLRPK